MLRLVSVATDDDMVAKKTSLALGKLNRCQSWKKNLKETANNLRLGQRFTFQYENTTKNSV